MSGQVDRAIETGRMLLARLGPPSPRAAHLHLGIARAALAGARWAEAAASIEVARESAGADAAEVDACAAQVAAGRGRLEEAERLARAALHAAEGSPGGHGVQPEVACEALEVIGRVARQRDLEAAERAFARAADLAARTACRCGGCGPCTSWAPSTSSGPRAWTGWSRPASWPWLRAHWP